MPDDQMVRPLDPPNADPVYSQYLETCRRLDVEAIPREGAKELISDWSAMIAAARHTSTSAISTSDVRG